MKIAVIVITTGVAAAAFGLLALLGIVAGEALGLGQAFGMAVAVGATICVVAGLRIAEHVFKSRMEEEA